MEPSRQAEKEVLDLLQNLRDTDTLKRLVWQQLSYDQVNRRLSRQGWAKAASEPLAEDPLLLASGGEGGAFHIIYSRLASDRLLIGSERPVVETLLRDHPYSLFVFSDAQQMRWHFVNVKTVDAGAAGADRSGPRARRRLFRRITVGPEERLRTAAERVTMLDLDRLMRAGSTASPLTIQQRHDEAFSVERVTADFYKDYRSLFNRLQSRLRAQTRDAVWAHDYSLQFLNRCMFVYFVQRKRWLNDDPQFMKTFWDSYTKSSHSRDSFFERWLSPLFFEAFNNRFHGGYAYFPAEIRQALQLAPYLNGGLFSQNELDRKYAGAFTLSDADLSGVLGFLEHYNFTISEDTPLDQEVAVDAEMLGKVYESLVNVSEADDEQGDAGIFYTPRTEIDLMCRLALVDHLANHLGQDRRQVLYEAIFAYSADEKQSADENLERIGLWAPLGDLLQQVTVVDPACGSGSFLVGMLQVLDDLQERANHVLGHQESAYERRRRIIGQSLYGVDVKHWAVGVAELRLWLQLVVDADLELADLQLKPLLPNLSFNIRQGDSLVQQVGGLNLAHRKVGADLDRQMKNRISGLKREKLKYYNGDPTGKYRTKAQLEAEEQRIFNDILTMRIQSLDQRRCRLQQDVDATINGLFGEQLSVVNSGNRRREIEEELGLLADELARAKQAQAALATAKKVPFVWDIAFVEIFDGERKGFDIVIGNPPYVRHEKIADPQLPRDKVTAENKKAYKAKLMRSAYATWPRFFGRDANAPIRKLSAKNDLYVYFYLHGLSLLNEKGSFCFITSNSWLDVGYGADLQEFLLRHGHVKMIIDNEVERSFLSAEVNTVIALLGPVTGRPANRGSELARFVMFTVPFEQVLSPIIFEEIEDAAERSTRPEYRLFPISYERLLEDGSQPVVEITRAGAGDRTNQPGHNALLTIGRYSGGMWGAKYLRAPDIYWAIVEKTKGKTVPLGAIADVRFGIKSGANEFFHLTAERVREWKIEEKYLRPLIKSPRDYYRIRIPGSDVWLFWCHDEGSKLRGTNALKYIKWGEAQGFDEAPSCRSRRNWYSVRGPEQPVLLWPSAFFERHIVYECPKGFVADKVFYTISGDVPLHVKAFLNSTIVSLFVEVEGYQLNHGGIFVTTDWLSGLPVPTDAPAALESLYESIAARDIHLCADELTQRDRQLLDAAFLAGLGLDPSCLGAMYESVVSHVAGRITKARRSTTKKGRQTRDDEIEVPD